MAEQNYCPHCGYKLIGKPKFCPQCGHPLTAETKEQVTMSKSHMFELRHDLGNLIPSRTHFITVLTFLKNNALTLFILFCVTTFLPVNSVRCWLLVAYLIFIYFYPLSTGKKRILWDERLDTWLQDKDSLHRFNEKVGKGFSQLQHVLPKEESHTTNTSEVAKSSGTTKDAISLQQKQTNTTTNKSQHHGFTWTGELICGIVSTVTGLVMYLVGKDATSSISSQAISVLQSGELDSGGYFYIWGIFLFGVGIAMLIGGTIKGITGHIRGGTLKIIAILICFVATIAATYVYSNPLTSAVNAAAYAYNSNTNIDTIQNLANIVKALPYIAGAIYGLGVLQNATTPKK